MRDHPPVGQGVAGAGRGLRPVGVDHEVAGGTSADVAAVQEQLVASGHLDTARRTQIAGVGEQQRRGKHSAGQRPAVSVEIGQHRVQQAGALHEPGFEGVPVAFRDHQRQRVELPGSGHGPAVAVGDRVAEVVGLDVGDAVVVDEAADRGTQPVQSATAAVADAVGNLLPGGAHIAVLVDELVIARVTRSGGGLQIEQCRLPPHGVVRHQRVVEVCPPDPARRCRTAYRERHYCSTVRTRRRSRIPGAPTSVDWRACFSLSSARSTLPGVKPVASKRRPRRDSASTALTGGLS